MTLGTLCRFNTAQSFIFVHERTINQEVGKTPTTIQSYRTSLNRIMSLKSVLVFIHMKVLIAKQITINLSDVYYSIVDINA